MMSIRMYLSTIGIIIVCLISGCQLAPKPDTTDAITPHGSELAVISFRDCALKDEPHCTGSGALAASRVASVLNDPPTLIAVIIQRPVGANNDLDDSSAATYGRLKGFHYVVNGEVLDYHPALFEPFHSQHVGITLRVVSTDNDKAVYSYSCYERFDILTPLSFALKNMTVDLRDSLEGYNLSGFQQLVWRGNERCKESSVKAFENEHGTQ